MGSSDLSFHRSSYSEIWCYGMRVGYCILANGFAFIVIVTLAGFLGYPVTKSGISYSQDVWEYFWMLNLRYISYQVVNLTLSALSHSPLSTNYGYITTINYLQLLSY